MPTQKHKILILGADGLDANNDSALLVSYGWDELNDSINIRDFDTLVFDLNHGSAASAPWEVFYKLMDFGVARDVLTHGGRIFVVGDPRIRFEIAQPDKATALTVPFTFWTGLEMAWDHQAGDTINFHENYETRPYLEYVRHLRKWEYSLAACKTDDSTVAEFFNASALRDNDLVFDFEITKIVTNRYRHGLLFTADIGFYSTRNSRLERPIGSICFLPPISATPDETIQIVLRDLCGFEAALPEPSWLNNFNAPDQKKVDEELAALQTEAKKLEFRKLDALARRLQCRECLQLL